MCQETLANLITRFLRCLAESGSAVGPRIYRDRLLSCSYPAANVNESIAQLQAAYQRSDCVAPSGVATEAGYFQHYADSRDPPCKTTCEYLTLGPYVQATLDCNQGISVPTECGSSMAWVRTPQAKRQTTETHSFSVGNTLTPH